MNTVFGKFLAVVGGDTDDGVRAVAQIDFDGLEVFVLLR